MANNLSSTNGTRNGFARFAAQRDLSLMTVLERDTDALDAAQINEIVGDNVIPFRKASNGRDHQPQLQPDRSEAERFLALLDPTATYFTFQTFDDDKERRKAGGSDPFAHILHGTLDECWQELCDLNAKGAGIYMTVNETDGKGRSIKNIKRVRALFNDLDGAPLEPVLKSRQPPHLVVESSPGKFHAYRFVTGIKLDQFEGLQKSLAAEFGSDPSVCDLPRVLRLPGFLHQKDKPFLSHIVSTHDAPSYSGDDFVATTQSLDGINHQSSFKRFADQRYGNSQWQELNSLALANLAAWVPELFPTAYAYHEGFRVSSADLGRANDEDLSFRQAGIKDFGVHDLDDPREGKRTPIDVVMEWGLDVSAEDLAQRENTDEFQEAAEWLRERLPKGEEAKYEEANHQPQPERVWPTLAPEALYGIPGKVVAMFEPHTEADPVALLLQFLICFGNALGRGPYYVHESDKHYTNLFGVLVGDTSKSRKGTSAGRIRHLMSEVPTIDSSGWLDRIEGGMSSGEGVIWKIRDEVLEVDKDGNEVVKVQAIRDKRLFLDEREFYQAFAVMKREGNTVSVIVRDAWDGKSLQALTKNSLARCREPHISISGHITEDELRLMLDLTSIANGYANRFLFACVRRSKFLPHGGNLKEEEIKALAWEINAVFNKVYMTHNEITMDAETYAYWDKIYEPLSEGKPGLLGAITGRAESQTIRLAMLYTILDCDGQNQPKVMKLAHLKAGLALWQYCEDSVKYIFGDRLGDPFTDELLRALQSSGGMSRAKIYEHFRRNQDRTKITTALETLKRYGKAKCEMRQSGGGRPVEFWSPV